MTDDNRDWVLGLRAGTISRGLSNVILESIAIGTDRQTYPFGLAS